MARVYKRYEKTVTRRELIGKTCDRCDTEMSIEHEAFRRDDLTIKRETGYGYPEGGAVQLWYIQDLCQECRLSLYNLLMSWGATITHDKIDF